MLWNLRVPGTPSREPSMSILGKKSLLFGTNDIMELFFGLMRGYADDVSDASDMDSCAGEIRQPRICFFYKRDTGNLWSNSWNIVDAWGSSPIPFPFTLVRRQRGSSEGQGCAVDLLRIVLQAASLYEDIPSHVWAYPNCQWDLESSLYAAAFLEKAHAWEGQLEPVLLA